MYKLIKKFYNLYTSSKISYQNIMCSKKYSYVSYIKFYI